MQRDFWTVPTSPSASSPTCSIDSSDEHYDLFAGQDSIEKKEPSKYVQKAVTRALGALVLLGALLYCWPVTGLSAPKRELQPYAIEGKLPNRSDFVIHLGGFCFPGDQFSSDVQVGNITLEVEGSEALRQDMGMLRVVFFNDEPDRWPVVQPYLEAAAQDQLIRRSNGCLNLLRWPPGVDEQEVQRTVHASPISEKFKRRWNVVLMGKGLERPHTMQYRVRGFGSTAHWSAGSDGPESGSCPVLPLEFLRQEVNQVFAPAAEDGMVGKRHRKHPVDLTAACYVPSELE
eukprot:TRINITY_DN10854_c0_g1_i3.p1 TRINITY_DN10854_c0_g1~~TRINITY_DN10854_c0_g1_i3.p1  ORF type:complete len:288 (+),score=36.31 TRINITY_DN10854_c0_g1_i3:77-940(+)